MNTMRRNPSNKAGVLHWTLDVVITSLDDFLFIILTSTGPGIVTSVLANKFNTVFGLDPSLPMLNEARINCSTIPTTVMDPEAGHARDVHFLRGCAENLSEFENDSVDLITSGTYPQLYGDEHVLTETMRLIAEAAHWFDHERAWPEMFRVLKKGGTIALWVSI